MIGSVSNDLSSDSFDFFISLFILSIAAFDRRPEILSLSKSSVYKAILGYLEYLGEVMFGKGSIFLLINGKIGS